MKDMIENFRNTQRKFERLLEFQNKYTQYCNSTAPYASDTSSNWKRFDCQFY